MFDLMLLEGMAATAAVFALLYASSAVTVFLGLFLFSMPGIRARRAIARRRRPEMSGMLWMSALWLPVFLALGFGALTSRRCRGGRPS